MTSEPHPAAIAGITSAEFAETARAFGEEYGTSSDEVIRANLSRPPMGIALTVSVAEQQHIDAMRARSIALAIERGHLRSQ